MTAERPKRWIRAALDRLGLAVVKKQTLQDLEERLGRLAFPAHDLAFLRSLPSAAVVRILPHFGDSRAQLRQDLLALLVTDFKVNGYFVEFGAADGERYSNTWLLERHFGWTGILAEPGRRWHRALRAKRKARIDTRCVWSRSGERIAFLETPQAEYSTIDAYRQCDAHAQTRRNGVRYDVETVSLPDLLAAHDAPRTIDYLSVDTEGSEFEILAAMDFDRYRFGLISVEHNHTGARERIAALLARSGYRRVLEAASGIDDWYVDGDARLDWDAAGSLR